ncbi:MAG TPA: SLBB domain-containing protein [Gemmatimonadaceae bacterium]|nr:SLBB domain-containing protein [Gemmatimonadaceae bacterium]
MKSNRLRLLIVPAILFAAPTLLRAQNPQGPTEAQRMLESNPLLLQQLRQRILSSGLTPEQVRARLRAEGYPETLLDAYLPGGTGSGAEIVNAGTPDDVLNAVSQLGIIDTLEAENLRCATIDTQDSLRAITDTSAVGRARRAVALAARQRCLERLDSLNFGRLSPADSARLKAQQDSGFVIFGLSTFRQRTTQFEPNLAGPVDPNYRLGPGDRLVLILTGDVSQSYTLPVTREGFIVVPQAGQIYVNNLTMGQLEDILYARLGRVYSGVRRGSGATTRFSINVASLRTNQIYVVGDVMQPGSYRISSAGTALSALYAARGPTDNGSLRNVQIKRAGRIVDILDVYDYLINGDASHDARLLNGDVVFVPVHRSRVRVVGEVVRPSTYELKTNETLADAIRFAGGFTPTAARTRVQIERIQAPNQRGEGGRDRVTIDIASSEFIEGTGPNVPVLPGDVIRVFKVTERVRNRIAVSGNVWQPGSLGLSPGMTVSQALRAAGGVKPDSYLGQVLVTRLNSDSTRVQLHAVLADTTGRVVGDFPLREDDQIRVFSVSEFRPERYVAITGAVRQSGQVAFREGMTARDLILQAGGLEQSADLREAEIARLPADRRGGQTATTSRVPLDSSYIFERGPDGKYFGPPGLPAANGSMPEIPLRPYDNVLIFRQPNWELHRTTVVSGEVTRPGTYSLTTKTERISDLIRRAGGLTPEAYADGVTFYRATDKVGRIGIALPEILRNPRSRDNLQLQDGDSIFIPRFNAVVNVKGAVNSPVAVTYVPGRSLEYYVRAAGGVTRRGDLRYAYVTQPNGKVEATTGKFIFRNDPRPRPGSTVYVPEKDASERRIDYIATIGSIAQLAASFVAIAIALRR